MRVWINFALAITMPHRLIGRTAVFGTVSLGSSPSGATLINPNILFISLLGFFVATNVATFLYGVLHLRGISIVQRIEH